MVAHGETDIGENIWWNDEEKRWEFENGGEYINGKRICSKCNKPQLDLNNVTDCDFCLQGLTACEFIDNACCGHGDDSLAYISLQDGRRWVLDSFDYGKVDICNYIQIKLNESVSKKMYDIIPEGFIEEAHGYWRALLAIKKGLIKRGLWETTVEEYRNTEVKTDGWR